MHHLLTVLLLNITDLIVCVIERVNVYTTARSKTPGKNRKKWKTTH